MPLDLQASLFPSWWSLSGLIASGGLHLLVPTQGYPHLVWPAPQVRFRDSPPLRDAEISRLLSLHNEKEHQTMLHPSHIHQPLKNQIFKLFLETSKFYVGNNSDPKNSHIAFLQIP